MNQSEFRPRWNPLPRRRSISPVKLHMQQTPSALTNTWGIGLDNNTAGHASTTVTDNGAGTSKVWSFGTTAGPFLGLVSTYQERGASAATLEKDYTWAQDPAGRPYIGSVTTTMDPGQTYQAQTKTAQTLDIYGNMTQSQIFDYGNLSTPARTYNYTYLTDWSVNQYPRQRSFLLPLWAPCWDSSWAAVPYGSRCCFHRASSFGPVKRSVKAFQMGGGQPIIVSNYKLRRRISISIARVYHKCIGVYFIHAECF
jgi:hypothetical protein